MLKPYKTVVLLMLIGPAAFGRLCVETDWEEDDEAKMTQPPSGGCVLKLLAVIALKIFSSSRLRAAVC